MVEVIHQLGLVIDDMSHDSSLLHHLSSQNQRSIIIISIIVIIIIIIDHFQRIKHGSMYQ